jgi:hypothetical protein
MTSDSTVNTRRAVSVSFGWFSAGIFTHLAEIINIETIYVFLVEGSSEQLLLRFVRDLRTFCFPFHKFSLSLSLLYSSTCQSKLPRSVLFILPVPSPSYIRQNNERQNSLHLQPKSGSSLHATAIQYLRIISTCWNKLLYLQSTHFNKYEQNLKLRLPHSTMATHITKSIQGGCRCNHLQLTEPWRHGLGEKTSLSRHSRPSTTRRYIRIVSIIAASVVKQSSKNMNISSSPNHKSQLIMERVPNWILDSVLV